MRLRPGLRSCTQGGELTALPQTLLLNLGAFRRREVKRAGKTGRGGKGKEDKWE